jgi:hypothetical protein
VPVLDPGRGRTKTGRLWVYVRDDRPSGDASPPAAVFFFSPDRKGERPSAHLAGFSGFLQADAYAGFDKLYGEQIIEVGCWAHARRKIFDVHESTKSPIAAAALAKIGELYRIETAIRGQPPDQRRDVRQRQARPLLAALKAWFEAQLAKLPPKGGLAQAIRYALANWTALTRYTEDGRLEIDNNRAENTLRGVALGRKNSHDRLSSSGASVRTRPAEPASRREEYHLRQRSGRRDRNDGRSNSHSGILRPMMTVRRRAASVWLRGSG